MASGGYFIKYFTIPYSADTWQSFMPSFWPFPSRMSNSYISKVTPCTWKEKAIFFEACSPATLSKVLILFTFSVPKNGILFFFQLIFWHKGKTLAICSASVFWENKTTWRYSSEQILMMRQRRCSIFTLFNKPTKNEK